MREVIWDFCVNRFHFLGMPVSKYVWIKIAKYLRGLLVSDTIMSIFKLGIKNAELNLLLISIFSERVE
jgi:hypothetical protein